MFNTRSLIRGAICVALIAVCSWISIPFAVPFTMQTFAVFLTAALLGSRGAALAVTVYILLGISGVPVFAGFESGVQALLNPTGGYILGFLPAVIMAGKIMGNGGMARRLMGMAVGLVFCYAVGTGWFMWVYARDSGGMGLWTALGICVLPFMIPDAAKLMLAAYISKRLKGPGRQGFL